MYTVFSDEGIVEKGENLEAVVNEVKKFQTKKWEKIEVVVDAYIDNCFGFHFDYEGYNIDVK